MEGEEDLETMLVSSEVRRRMERKVLKVMVERWRVQWY